MNNKPISQKDIADMLGVSISTISRAISGSNQISKEMRNKVMTLVKEHNYHPNPFSIGLLKNTPGIIGIIVPDIVTHFYSSIISGISDVARASNYSVIITSSYEQFELEKQCIDSLIKVRVEGIVACLSQTTHDYSAFEQVIQQNIPVVFFDRVCMQDRCPAVVVDNEKSAYTATEHLINGGSHRIAFVGGNNMLDIVRQRKHGYLNALREHGIKIDKELIICNEMSFGEGRNAARKLLSLDKRPDGILAANDSLTFGIMKEIRNTGLKIPDDISLIGYTDEQHSTYVEPTLTAITHHTYDIGTTACKLLLKRIQEPTTQAKTVEIPTHLVIRRSTKQ